MKKQKFTKLLTLLLTLTLAFTGMFSLTACGGEKNISVISRDLESGTREAFDTVVSDGNGNYLLMKIDGKKYRYVTDKAISLDKTGMVKTQVASDKNAIGYVSLSAVDDTVKMLSVEGVLPSEESILDGSYKIQRPFVIMTNSNVTLTEAAADFLAYLKSEAAKDHVKKAGGVFLSNPKQRANEGEPEIPVESYERKASFPSGGTIVVKGSTSMEEVIKNAMSGYAALYGKDANEIFSLDLQGSSVGEEAVRKDKNGNVIGLSSAAVKQEGINSFNICLDAVAVIVNKNNESVSNITISQLYGIYTGKILKFSELSE